MDPRLHSTQERRAFLGCTYWGRSFADDEEIESLRALGDVGLFEDAEERRRTRGHVPSKALLDDPLPTTLPTVACCRRCNNGFSRGERYLACLLECVVSGGTDPTRFERAKVARMFQEPGSASLRERISEARRESADGLAWEMDREQVLPVVEKLARGHVAYEEYPRLAGPTSISIHPLACMSELERREFEDGAGCGRLFPELGSLALARVSKEAFEDSWVEVQTGRYRYSFSVFDTHLSVRIVVREYLACEAIWDCA